MGASSASKLLSQGYMRRMLHFHGSARHALVPLPAAGHLLHSRDFHGIYGMAGRVPIAADAMRSRRNGEAGRRRGAQQHALRKHGLGLRVRQCARMAIDLVRAQLELQRL